MPSQRRGRGARAQRRRGVPARGRLGLGRSRSDELKILAGEARGSGCARPEVLGLLACRALEDAAGDKLVDRESDLVAGSEGRGGADLAPRAWSVGSAECEETSTITFERSSRVGPGVHQLAGLDIKQEDAITRRCQPPLATPSGCESLTSSEIGSLFQHNRPVVEIVGKDARTVRNDHLIAECAPRGDDPDRRWGVARECLLTGEPEVEHSRYGSANCRDVLAVQSQTAANFGWCSMRLFRPTRTSGRRVEAGLRLRL